MRRYVLPRLAVILLSLLTFAGVNVAAPAPDAAETVAPTLNEIPPAPPGYTYVGIRQFEGVLYHMFVNGSGEVYLSPV